MGDITVIDDVLSPSDTIVVKYKGKNPFVAASVPTALIREVMKLPGKDILETDVRWEAMPGNTKRSFYGRWMGKRSEDRWTTTRLRIVVQGEQDPQDRIGWVIIELKGTLKTVYNYSNFLQKWFWYFYSRSFYNNQRRMYAEFAKDNLYEMKERYQRILGILPPRET